MTSLINKSACKNAVLEIAEGTRGGKFTRVGSDVYEHLNDMVLNTIRKIVHQHPSVGKTIMMGSRKRNNLNEGSQDIEQ